MPSDRALALATQWDTEAAIVVGGETVPDGHRHTQSDIDDLTIALDSKVSASQIGLDVAPLVAGKVPVHNLPDISTTRGVYPVASQAAMLALPAQVGAVAVRSDLNGQSYILAALPASNLSNWLSQSPPGTVTSVNGQTGAVTIPVPAGDRLILSAQGATANQTLRYNGTAIVWATPVIWPVRNANATLAANENCMADTGVTALTLPVTVTGSHEIANNTTTSITINRGGTATISGVTRSTGAAITAQTAVRILPGQRGVFVANGGNWIAQGCELFSFAYNGTPLALNSSNPLGASDLFHYLGIMQGGGSWVNPANTAFLTAVQSSNSNIGVGTGSISVLSDRAGPSNLISSVCHTDNVANSWFGWELPIGYWFVPKGFLLMTRGDYNGPYPRSFRVQVDNDGSGLTSATNISAWATAVSYSNQTQINANSAYYPFSFENTTGGRRFAFQMTGVDSASANYLISQEMCWFGDLALP